MLLRAFTTLTLAIASVSIAANANSVLISSYFDDPFVDQAAIKRMDPSVFGQARDGRPTLRSNRVWVTDEDYISKVDKQTGVFKPFAWNPWPQTWTNPRWDLVFSDEERFPVFRPLRGPDNQIVLKDGLQVWLPQDLNLANATAFEAANAVKDAADLWSGRPLDWGVDGGLLIETHAFIDFNAFYSFTARSLFFGVVPYRFAGHTEVNFLETASSWDMVAHEAGHAVEFGIKPNLNPVDTGVDTWGESFADQVAMWTSLRNPERVSRLLAETKGDFNHSNSLTRIVEAFAALVGTGTGIRDAFHDLKVSDTSDEAHDRSQVFTGASYKLFRAVYAEQKRSLRDEDALSEAARIMGDFIMHAPDYAPENRPVLQDIVKGCLKVDKEFFGGRYYDMLVGEFTRRELLDASSLQDWLAHEDALPLLWLPSWSTDSDVAKFVELNQDRLGTAPDFGLKLQSVTRLTGVARERMIVRVQLTQGRGADATPLGNHGILVFRANGDLADYHSPVPGGVGGPGSDKYFREQAAIGRARQARLHLHGAPLSLVRKADGSLSAEAQVLRGEGLNAYVEVFTPENPAGERREILHSPLSPAQSRRIADVLGVEDRAPGRRP